MALLLYAVIADRHQEESRERPETRACPTTEYDPHVFPVAASRRDRRVARLRAAGAVRRPQRRRARAGGTGIRARRVKIAPHAQAADPVAPRARLSPPGRRGAPARSRGDVHDRSGRRHTTGGGIRSRLRRALAAETNPSRHGRPALDAGDVGGRRAASRSLAAARLHPDQRTRRLRRADVRVRVRVPAGARAPRLRQARVAG